MGIPTFTLSQISTMTSFNLDGYTGFYGRQLALLDKKSASAASAAKYDAAFTASAAKKVSMSSSKTTSVQEKTTTTVERSTKTKIDLLKEQKSSLEYGKSSKCAALRRAEIHAQNSGKDPRHVPVPRKVGDDICKVVADIHMSPFTGKEAGRASALSQQHSKVERMEKELSALTKSVMSYKSIYKKSASQLAAEAMAACDTGINVVKKSVAIVSTAVC